MSNPTPNSPSGILIVDKPTSWTSFDVVAKVRRIFKIKKVGHAGTLDPMATGVLIVLVGQATKWSDQLLSQDKQYIAEIQFGRQTDTGDADGEVVVDAPVANLAQSAIEKVLPQLTGSRDQMVPAYAAVKVNGQKLYQLARAGRTMENRPIRHITISQLNLMSFQPHPQYPTATISVHCSKGTYIRVLAEEIASQLNTVAHLIALQRTASGTFTLDQAITLTDLQQSDQPEQYLQTLPATELPS